MTGRLATRRLVLDGFSVRLKTGSPVILAAWDSWLEGWPIPLPVSDDDVILNLHLVDRLERPTGTPLFVDERSEENDDVGALAVYPEQQPGRVTLFFVEGACVSVPLTPRSETPWQISGYLTRAIFASGRFEDVILTSIAPALRRCDGFIVHAFGARLSQFVALIVGASGSGKTTTGLGLLNAGWELLGNDSVLLRDTPAGVAAAPMPGHVSIRPKTLHLLPFLGDLLVDQQTGEDGKLHLSPTQLTGAHYACPGPVTHFFFPEVVDRNSKVTPMQAAVCMARLAEESVDRWDSRCLDAHLDLLERTALQATGYTLALGHDSANVPDLIKGACR